MEREQYTCKKLIVGALGSRQHLGYDMRRGISLGWMPTLMKVRQSPRII